VCGVTQLPSRRRASAAVISDWGGARWSLTHNAANIGGMDRQILWDWAIRFKGQGPAGLFNIISPGDPIPAVHGMVRWSACDLIMRLHEEFGITVSDGTNNRALKDLGFSPVSARPQAYKQDPERCCKLLT
jgi:transposase